MGMHPSQLQSCQSCNWVKDELGVDTSPIQMQTIPGGVWPRLRKSPDPVTAGLDSLVLVKSLVLGKGFTATDPAGPDSTMRGREVIQPKPIGYPESMLSGKRPVLSEDKGLRQTVPLIACPGKERKCCSSSRVSCVPNLLSISYVSHRRRQGQDVMTMAHFLHQNFILVRTDPREPTPPPQTALSRPKSPSPQLPHHDMKIIA